MLSDGKKVLLHIEVGDRESYEARLGFLRDEEGLLSREGLGLCGGDHYTDGSKTKRTRLGRIPGTSHFQARRNSHG